MPFTKHSHYSEPHRLSVRCFELVFLSLFYITAERVQTICPRSHSFWAGELGLLAPSSTDALQCPALCPLDAPPELRDSGTGGSWPWGPLPSSSSAPCGASQPGSASTLHQLSLAVPSLASLVTSTACRTPLLKPCSLGFLLGSRLHS